MVFRFYFDKQNTFIFEAPSVESAQNWLLKKFDGLSEHPEDGSDWVGNYLSILSTTKSDDFSPLFVVGDDSVKTITLYVSKMSSWCVSDLMYLYSKNTQGVYFIRDKYMTPSLIIEGKKYRCSRWTIRPDENDGDFEKVTIDLYEFKQERR